MWRDTVMGDEILKVIAKTLTFHGVDDYVLLDDLLVDLLPMAKEIAKTQAKISFKAGQEDGVIKGHKEVVEFVESQEQDDGVDSLNYFVVEKEVWQAKLGEWGYED